MEWNDVFNGIANETIATRLTWYADRKNMSPSELATVCKVHPNTIRRVLKDGKVSIETLLMITLTLNVSLDWITGRTNELRVHDETK